jgi:hypothetical protein
MIDSETKSDQSLYKRRRVQEWIFSLLATFNCLIVSLVFIFPQLSDAGLISIWPFPLVYFVEIILIGIICVVAIGMLRNKMKSNWSGIPWICSGVLLAFVIMGAWTIGFYLIPAMILFMLTGVVADRRTQGDIALHLIFFVSAGIVQASIVFVTFLG